MRRFEHVSTGALRAAVWGFSQPGLRRVFRRVLVDVRSELLARELPAIAAASRAFVVAEVPGIQ